MTQTIKMLTEDRYDPEITPTGFLLTAQHHRDVVINSGIGSANIKSLSAYAGRWSVTNPVKEGPVVLAADEEGLVEDEPVSVEDFDAMWSDERVDSFIDEVHEMYHEAQDVEIPTIEVTFE